MKIVPGMVAEHAFVVSEADMAAFISLSGDRSKIHTDSDYARRRGYPNVIVYGGIILAKLSYILGSMIPGDRGVSVRWTIDYRKALHVGEAAAIELTVTGTSPSTGLVEAKFAVRVGGRVIATGRTQSVVPREELEGAA